MPNTWGFCEVQNRWHKLDDFTSRQHIVNGRLMNVTVCRQCGKYPGHD